MKILDISQSQTNLNMTNVIDKNDIDMVFVKISEGIGWESPSAKKQIQQVLNTNATLGIYHYIRYDDPYNTPEKEVNSFLTIASKLGVLKKQIPVMVDYERPSDKRDNSNLALETYNLIKQKFDNVYLYSYESMAKKYDFDSLNIPLWIANYGTNNGFKQLNYKPTLTNTYIWQYTSAVKYDNIAVDLSVELKELTNYEPVVEENINTDVLKFHKDDYVYVKEKTHFVTGETPAEFVFNTRYQIVSSGIKNNRQAYAISPTGNTPITGWVYEEDLLKSDYRPLQVGDTVYVKKNSKFLNGQTPMYFVFNTEYKIVEISNDKVLISPTGKLPATGWFDKKNILLKG